MYLIKIIVNFKFRTETSVLLIFIVDYSEKEYGNGMKNGNGRKGPL